MARKVFYSFHYQPDVWRASMVRKIGAIEGNEPAKDHDWESVTKGGDAAIGKWIAQQMQGRTCTVVLVGTNTANRKWVNYEIVKSWNDGLGLVGIRIHGLENAAQQVSSAGANPFDYVTFGSDSRRLSSVVKCYDPPGNSSKERYGWVATYIADAIEEAIAIRAKS